MRVVNPSSALLPGLALDAWLLASHRADGVGTPEGRAWEREVASLLARPGLSQYQGAGFTTLFGARSASGCGHELDGAARGGAGQVLVECKALAAGVTKDDAVIFDAKTFDFYAAALPHAAKSAWWRLLISATPVSDGVRRLCATKAIIVIEPTRVPWPILIWLSGRPSADDWLAEPLLREALRLGPRACATIQQRWPHDGQNSLVWDLAWWSTAALDDLTYVQDELGGDWLDLLDREAPGWLESKAEPLVRRLAGCA